MNYFMQIVDPLASPGWAGAGLLGLVLAWLLLRHLPAKDAQLEGLIARHITAMQEARADFAAALASVIKHCEDEMKEIVKHYAEKVPAVHIIEKVPAVHIIEKVP